MNQTKDPVIQANLDLIDRLVADIRKKATQFKPVPKEPERKLPLA